MDFFEVVTRRRSIRSFQTRPIEADKLRQILEAANAAPSAGNLQGYEIHVVGAPEQRRALAKAALEQTFLAQAPVALVFCTNAQRSVARYRERGRRLYAVQDATIAATFAMLAATALGLATVWIGAFDDDAVWRVIGSPAGQVPVAILPIGYPAEEPAPTARRPLEELIHWRQPSE